MRLHGTLRGTTGLHLLTLDPQTAPHVRTALDQAVALAPELAAALFAENGALGERVVVFCNGRNIAFRQGLSTPLGPNDRLDVFPKTGVQRAFAQDGSG